MSLIFDKKSKAVIFWLIILFGFVIRLSFFIGNKFPLHDGGFFYVLIEDLLSNEFSLPVYSSYNNANIPFVYPPFGFYFIGLIETAFSVDRLQLMRIIPLLVTSLTIPAFYYLALELSKEDRVALLATFFYSILPLSYKWLILGGGITRAFGALFGILALMFSVKFMRGGKWSLGGLGALFCGLTVLSHPEWAWFLFYSLGLFIVITLIKRWKKILLRALIILLGTLIVALPWLVNIFGDKFFLPLMDSGSSKWVDIINLLTLNWSGEALIPIITILALVGLTIILRKKEWFLLVWLPVIFVLQGRGAIQKATIPLALLAGEGLINVFDYFQAKFSNPLRSNWVKWIAAFLLVYLLVGNTVPVIGFAQPLSDDELDSIVWIENSTPVESSFLMISSEEWGSENYSEWMVALSGRQSVSVVQGYEWLPDFSSRVARYNTIQYEYSRGMADLLPWLQENNIQVDYMVIPKTVNSGLEVTALGFHWDDVSSFPGVESVYENDGLLIFDISQVHD